MKISNFKLALAFPLSFPMVPSDFFFGCMSMERPQFVMLRAENGPIDAMRNNLVEDAIRHNCSHIMMMDCDMVYHPLTVPTLLAHKLPVVGALCYRRYPPFDPLMLQDPRLRATRASIIGKRENLLKLMQPEPAVFYSI